MPQSAHRTVRSISNEISRSTTATVLEGNEERLKLAAEIAGISAWEWDIESGKTVWSEKMPEMFGLASGELADTYQAFLKIVHPDDRVKVDRAISDALNDALGSYQVEYRFLRRDGKIRWMLMKGRTLCNERGRATRMFAVNIDLTERKRVEMVLKESEHRFREMLENVQLIAVMLDRQGNLTFCNDFLLKLTDQSPDEVVGRNWFDTFVPEEDREEVRNRFFTAIAQGTIPSQYVNDIQVRNQERRTIFWNNTVLRDEEGNIIGTTSIGEDITERKRVEEVLQASKLQYESLVNSINGIVWEIDAQTSAFTFVSEQAKQLLGYSSEQWLAEPDFWSKHLHSDDLMWVADVRQKATAKRENHQFEYRMIAADGRVVWLREIMTVNVTDDGSLRLRSVAFDVSKNKQIEECVRNIAEGLSGATGEAFFHSLVKYLAKTLSSDYAFVGEVSKDNSNIIRTVSACADGQIIPNFEYHLQNTPCQNVVGKQLCIYPSGVQKTFPQDLLLVEMGVESYAGTPLFDSHQGVLGLMVVLSRQPSDDPELCESILRIFASRAAAELERMDAEEDLLASTRRLQRQNEAFVNLAKRRSYDPIDLRAALKEITEETAHALDVERTSVWLYNDDRSKIVCLDLYEKSASRHTEGNHLAAEDYPEYFRALEEEPTIAAHDAYTDGPKRRGDSGLGMDQCFAPG